MNQEQTRIGLTRVIAQALAEKMAGDSDDRDPITSNIFVEIEYVAKDAIFMLVNGGRWAVYVRKTRERARR